jgi:hypothetical protein
MILADVALAKQENLYKYELRSTNMCNLTQGLFERLKIPYISIDNAHPKIFIAPFDA